MKYTAALAGLLAAALAKEMPKDEVRARELYDSGVIHEQIMAKKLQTWDEESVQGLMSAQAGADYLELPFVQCKNGRAQPFRDNATFYFLCNNMNMHHFLPHTKLGSQVGLGSSSWGWISDDGREFAIIAQGDGVAFAEITNAGKLQYLGRLPQPAGLPPSNWREVRTYKHYIVVASETFDHHVQIFDLHKILDIDYRQGPVTFDPSADLTGYWPGTNDGRAHNVLTNEETGFAYVVGARPRNSTCMGGLMFVDLSDPSNPTSPGCAYQDGYVHDAQCVIYKGPDSRYLGKEICYAYNEDSLTIYDVTDKKWPEIISVTSYEGATYTHQGWLLNTEWQEWLIMDDELDEREARGPAANGRPTTFIWDIRDLEKPKQTGYYQGPKVTIDHNQYIFGNYAYQSNYGAGVSVLDISSIPTTPSGAGIREVASFDIYPEDDGLRGGGILEYVGTWSSYAGYPSGYILVNTIERGAYVIKVQNPPAGMLGA